MSPKEFRHIFERLTLQPCPYMPDEYSERKYEHAEPHVHTCAFSTYFLFLQSRADVFTRGNVYRLCIRLIKHDADESKHSQIDTYLPHVPCRSPVAAA